jgi:predicted ATPase
MLIKRLTLKKILSFNDATVELGPLNVLIGPNAVGKSNLIEVIGLLQASPTSLASAILRGGGVHQWIWLGDRVASPIASIGCELEMAQGRHVHYSWEFSEDSAGFVIFREQVGNAVGLYLDRAFNGVEFGPEAAKLLNPYQGA